MLSEMRWLLGSCRSSAALNCNAVLSSAAASFWPWTDITAATSNRRARDITIFNRWRMTEVLCHGGLN